MALRVNGEEIPESAIEYELRRLVEFYSQHMPGDQLKHQEKLLRAKAREQAIGGKLLIDRAQQMDLEPPVADIDQRLKEIVEQSGGREKFEEILNKQHMTEAMVRDTLTKGRRVDMLVERVCSDVPEPTEEDIEAHFKEHAAEYETSERVQAQHVLIKPASDSKEDRETARSKLLEIRQKIEDGTEFADMAAAHSECPSGQQNGGSLGWFARGMMVPQFDEAVFSMNVGELSEIIETEFGFHIIKKTAEEPGGEPELPQVQDKIRDFLRHARRGEALSAFVNELKEKALIEDD